MKTTAPLTTERTCQWGRCTRPAATTRRGAVARTILQGGGLAYCEKPVCAKCAALIDGPPKEKQVQG